MQSGKLDYENQQTEYQGSSFQDQAFPDSIRDVAAELNILPEEYDSFSDGELTLYRGDTEEIYSEMRQEGFIERDFPIFFVDSRERAIQYINDKIHSNNSEVERLLVEANIPSTNIAREPLDLTSIEVGRAELRPDQVYFNNEVINGHSEWSAVRIPEDWITIDRNI